MLPKANRLKLPVRWSRVNPDYQLKTPYFKVLVKLTTSKIPTKVGILVTSKLGKATVRNKVRRQLSSLLYQGLNKLGEGKEVVIITFPALAGASDEEISTSLNQVLSKAPFTVQ